jgi:3-methyl-2-oxobutanoate hydroxymethyltransferase
VMTEINRRTGLVTVSLGSGPSADVIFLFTSDICGEAERLPRHARSWGQVGQLQRAIREERRMALRSFRAEVEAGSYPAREELAGISEAELQSFRGQFTDVPSKLT